MKCVGLRSRRLILLAGCWVLLNCGSVVSAQSFYDIEGGVYGPSGAPVGGIAIFLEDITRSRVGQTITANDGRYRFTRVGAGVYFVVANPNDKQLKQAVHRVELLNTTTVGTNTSVERLDINLSAFPRAANSIGTLFAQDVPPAAEAEYERAMQSLTKKETPAAVTHLNQALNIFPSYFLALQQLGLIYLETKQYQQAIPPLVKALEVNPKAASSFLALGIASLELGRSDLALDALERSRRLDDKSFRVHLFLGLAFVSLNRLDEAEGSLRESLRLGGPARASVAHLHLAAVHSKRGKNRQAIDELELYLRENPKAGNLLGVQEAIKRLKMKL